MGVGCRITGNAAGTWGPHFFSASHGLEGLSTCPTPCTERSVGLLPPQGDREINERPFVKPALILSWKEHLSPKYKGDDSLIRSSGFCAPQSRPLSNPGQLIKAQRPVGSGAGAGKLRSPCFQGGLCPPLIPTDSRVFEDQRGCAVSGLGGWGRPMP